MNLEDHVNILNHSFSDSVQQILDESKTLDGITSSSPNVKREREISEQEQLNEVDDGNFSNASCEYTTSNEDDVSWNLDNDAYMIASDEYLSNDSEDECAIFLCNECGKKFNNGASLKAHLAKKHNPRALVTCELCDIKYRGDFIDHLEAEHKSLEGKYSCKKCSFISIDNGGILKHRHEKDVFNVCKQCGKIYKSKENYKLHLLVHSNKDSKKKKEKSFTCDTCGKKFHFACLLRDHVNVHTGTKPYSCQICGISFRNRANKVRHTRRIHAAEEPFKCTECGKCFKQSTGLVSHTKRIHTKHLQNSDMCG